MDQTRETRLTWRQRRRRKKLIAKLSELEKDLKFSTDFFVGEAAGPLVRYELNRKIVAVREELLALGVDTFGGEA